MKTIEELVALFSSIPLAEGGAYVAETLVTDRLHLSRGPLGEFACFVEGPFATFGSLPPWSGVEHSGDIAVVPAGRRIAALRITCHEPAHGNRVVAHIAYELARRLLEQPGIDNQHLIEGVAWVLPLLGDPEALISEERQLGLVGELILLRGLVEAAIGLGKPAKVALERWKGPAPGMRDFAAVGLAIEVKATSQPSRRHYFASLSQLDPQAPGEEVFLYSVGLRRDPSAAKKLPDFVTDIEVVLVDENDQPDPQALAAFRDLILQYGYNGSHSELYRTQPGFAAPHLPPALFREQELDRVRLTSFKGDVLPAMVVNVGYTLDVQSAGLSHEAARLVVEKLLQAQAIS